MVMMAINMVDMVINMEAMENMTQDMVVMAKIMAMVEDMVTATKGIIMEDIEATILVATKAIIMVTTKAMIMMVKAIEDGMVKEQHIANHDLWTAI